MSGTAGANIGTTGSQPAIGAYVQDAVEPSADTNYIGVNTAAVWDSNVIAEDYAAGFSVLTNQEAATSGTSSFVEAGEAIVVGDGLALASGVATVDNATGTHTAFAAADAGQFLWAVEGFTP